MGTKNQIKILAIASLAAFALSLCRVYLSQSKGYLFLNWNLFLALIPFGISLLFINKLIKFKGLAFFLFIIYILFLPNAPYILTDLFHIKVNCGMPTIWYDLFLILTFAFIGLLSMIWSMQNMLYTFSNMVSKFWLNIIASALIFLISFGIYLGRFLRFNSWDIMHNPQGILHAISSRILNPMEHPRTWILTLMMGFILNLMFWSYYKPAPQKVQE